MTDTLFPPPLVLRTMDDYFRSLEPFLPSPYYLSIREYAEAASEAAAAEAAYWFRIRQAEAATNTAADRAEAAAAVAAEAEAEATAAEAEAQAEAEDIIGNDGEEDEAPAVDGEVVTVLNDCAPGAELCFDYAGGSTPGRRVTARFRRLGRFDEGMLINGKWAVHGLENYVYVDHESNEDSEEPYIYALHKISSLEISPIRFRGPVQSPPPPPPPPPEDTGGIWNGIALRSQMTANVRRLEMLPKFVYCLVNGTRCSKPFPKAGMMLWDMDDQQYDHSTHELKDADFEPFDWKLTEGESTLDLMARLMNPTKPTLLETSDGSR